MARELPGSRVKHPAWCDRSLCEAPDRHPTTEEYRAATARGGAHRSAPVALTQFTAASLNQSVAPWPTSTHLDIRDDYRGGLSFPLDTWGEVLQLIVAGTVADDARYGGNFAKTQLREKLKGLCATEAAAAEITSETDSTTRKESGR